MAVNKVNLNGETLLDLTSDTVTPENLDYGVTAHAANGQVITGVRLHCKIYSTNSPAMTAENDVFSWTIPATEHGLDSGNLLVSVYDNAGKKVLCDIGISTDYAVAVSFVSNGSSAADAGAYKVVIVGCKSVPTEEETPDPVPIIYGGTGARTALQARNNLGFALDNLIPRNAGAHNAVYGGRSLGSAVTTAQWAAIQAGTFEDLFIGDFWEIGGVNWRIAAFDYYFSNDIPDHHVVIVPDASLYTAKMNASSTTRGGYAGSQMRTTNLATAKTTINNAFGSDHILTYRDGLVNAVSSGAPSGISTYECTVELMTERQVYGNPIFGACAWGSSTVPALNTKARTQFPLFALNPYLASLSWYWLRDIVTDAYFAASNGAAAGYAGAFYDGGVRPYFCVKA